MVYKKLPIDIRGNEPQVIFRVNDATFIPFDPANTDYQAYLKWLEEGNTPLPADE
jgi:hypothetical protein